MGETVTSVVTERSFQSWNRATVNWVIGQKAFHGSLQTIQAIAKTISYFSQTDIKTPLLKTIPTVLNEHGETKLVPT